MRFVLGVLGFWLAGITVAYADPLSAIIIGGLALTGAAATAVSIVVPIAVSFGLSYVASKLLTKKVPEPAAAASFEAAQNVGGAQLDIKAASDIPFSLIVGRAVTGGSRVYTNTFGNTDSVENSDLIEIIALADHPCTRLAGAFVAGLPCAFKSLGSDEGARAEGYTGSIGVITPDAYLAGFGLPAYGSTDENGAYASGLLTNYNGKLRVRFFDGTQTSADSLAVGVLGGDPDYPWPATAVGTGLTYVRIHSSYDGEKIQGPMQWTFVVDGIRLYDPRKDSTVGGSGGHVWGVEATYEWTDNVAVIVYNIIRGIYVNGKFFYGIEGTAASQLPLSIWFAAMNECDAPIALAAGGTEPQFRAGGEISIENEPLETCKALLKACGGRLVEIGGVFKLYVGAPDVPVLTFQDGDLLANKADAFNLTLPLTERVNYVTGKFTSPADGWVDKIAAPRGDPAFEAEDGRRLPADLTAPMVQSETQLQRLQTNLLQRARRERKHIIPLPPIGMVLEPGDVFEWNSERNGYVTKLFEIDGVDYDSNLNVTVSATEVDPADYDWDASLEFSPVDMLVVVREPGAKVVTAFTVIGFVYLGDNSTAVPAIKLTWTDPQDADSINLLWQVRAVADPSGTLMSGSTSNVAGGVVIIAGGLNPSTTYEVRARFESQHGYPSAWSSWLSVTTPNIRLVLAHFSEELRNLVTKQFTEASDQLAAIEQRIAAAASEQDAHNWLDTNELKVTTTAEIGGVSASVTTNSVAIADINTGLAAAGWSVILDVNGYVSSLKAFNDGSLSGWTFLGNIFQVAFPGVSGGAPVPVFQIANVSGSPKVTIRADVLADGTVSAQKMVTGTITAASAIIADAAILTAKIADAQITAAKIIDAQITTAKIVDLNVSTLKIDDFAVTFPKVVSEAGPNLVTGNYIVTDNYISGHIAGKTLQAYVSCTVAIGYFGSGSGSHFLNLYVEIYPAAGGMLGPYNVSAQGMAITAFVVGGATLTGSVAYTPPDTGTFLVRSYLTWINSTTGGIQLDGRTMYSLVTKR